MLVTTIFSFFPKCFHKASFSRVVESQDCVVKEKSTPNDRILKTQWEKEKLLATSNFSFSHRVCYQFGGLSAIFIQSDLLSTNSFSMEESKKFLFDKGLTIITCIHFLFFESSRTSFFTKMNKDMTLVIYVCVFFFFFHFVLSLSLNTTYIDLLNSLPHHYNF